MKRILFIMGLLSIFTLFSCKNTGVQNLLAKLDSSSPDQVDKIIKDLNTTIEKGVSIEDAKKIVSAIGKNYPKRKYDFQNTNVDIIRSLRNYDSSLIVDDLLLLSSSSDENINSEIVYLLSFVNSDKAVNAIISILNLSEGKRPKYLNLNGWKEKQFQSNVIFPRILDFGSDKKYFYEIGLVTLAYSKSGKIDLLENEVYINQLINLYNEAAISEQKLALDNDIPNWFYNDDYNEIRSNNALILDILGYTSSEQAIELLQNSLLSKDPRIVYFAISSLLNHNIEIDNNYITFVAKDNEMRKWLFSLLKEKKLTTFLNSVEFSQENLAISDMVNWLIYPTELATAPDQIELLKVIRMDTKSENGLIDYYIFKFRTNEPHWAAKDGWLVGVSGPFLVKDYPSIDSYGDTFSSFEPYDGRDPEEYLGNVQEILDKWKK